MIYRYILDLIDDGLIRKGRVLDIGCGKGGAAILLASLGFKVEAIDKVKQDFIATTFAEAFGLKGAKLVLEGTVDFIQADVREFTFTKNFYDFIHARHVLHFLNKKEMSQTIQKMFEALATGGVLFFTVTGNKDSWNGQSKNVTFLSEKDLERYVETPLKTPLKKAIIYNKVTKVGYGTTTSGIKKLVHTISYTVRKMTPG